MTATGEAAVGDGRPLQVGVLGPYLLDVLGRPVEALPTGQGGALLEEIRITVAGTGGAAAISLAKLGCRVAAFGAIGDDAVGRFLVTELRARDVDVSGLVVKDGEPTSATILPIRPNGDRPALHVPGATRQFGSADLEPAEVLACQALLIGGPEVMPRLLDDQFLGLVGQFREHGGLVFVDLLSGGSPRSLQRLSPLLPSVDWLLPNEDQLLALTGLDDLTGAASRMLSSGVGAVAVTQGPQGAVVFRPDGEPVEVPAFPTDVVDTSGCGDSFNAGMIAGLLRGCSASEAAVMGTACGALVASGLGSDAGFQGMDEVLQLLETRSREAADKVRAGAWPETSP